MLRTFVASSLGIASGIFGFTAGKGLTGSWLAAALIAAIVAGLVALFAYRRASFALDVTACSRRFKIFSALATLVALIQLARLAVFTVDPSRVEYSFLPASKWEVQHSCLSAYFIASEAASSQVNIYDNLLYSMPDDDPSAPRKPRMLGPFNIDVYEYPPQFLLLPRALATLTPDFMDFRMVWFALNGGVLLLAFVVVARFLGPADGTRALLLSPLVWVLATINTLQKGNAQAIIIAASMLAMVLFHRRRWAAGGLLLAFATVSKLFPGLLIIYLLAQRQWRAVAWTTAFAVAFTVLTFLTLGWGPYAAFLDHLPGLVSGEAFPAFRRPAAMAINCSIPGLVFKLQLFGVPGISFGVAKIVGWLYTLVAVAVTILAGLRPLRDREKPLVWMAVLILATLRSPFLPQIYAVLPPLWLLTLLAAGSASTRLSLVLFAWAALNVYWPIDWPIDPRLLATANTVPQVAMVLLVVVALRRARYPHVTRGD